MKKIIVLLLVALSLVGCGSKPKEDKDLEKIVIGGTALPHADFLKQLEKPLKEQGYELEVKVFDDYILPNKALQDGNLDANFFQHTPYLTDFNEKHNTDLVPALQVHYEPIAIYAGLKASLDDVAAGDKVVVPDDATNLPRALKLLEQIGWITLNENKDTATLKDIVEKKVDIDITLTTAENTAKLLSSSAYAIVNGNFALVGNITEKGLQAEKIDDETIQNSVNVIAVRRGEENSEKTQAILKAFNDPEVVKYIETKYAPAVISTLKAD